MPKPYPGWFDDGSGQQRWWDGQGWTDYYFDAASGAVIDRGSELVGTTTPTAKPPGVNRWTRLVILSVVLVVIVALWGLAGLLLAGGLVAGAIGLYAVWKGSFGRLRIRTRPVAVAVLVAGVFVTSVGGAALATNQADKSDVAAFVSTGPASTQTATPSPNSKPTPTPVRKEAIIEETAPIAFTSSNVDDPNLDAGLTAVATAGAHGQKVTRIRVITVDGVEISREVVEEVVTVQPVNEIIAIGSRQAPPPPPPAPVDNGCDPNYEGACVPVSSDVDCAGGSGNGPAYVDGPVWIVGSDVYDLDRDGDGIACDA